MAAMFAVGVMNLIWIAALTAVMVVEKLTRGEIVSRIVGLALIAMGAGLIATSPVWLRFWALL
jgi:predicted metal-binding membrane protein